MVTGGSQAQADQPEPLPSFVYTVRNGDPAIRSFNTSTGEYIKDVIALTYEPASGNTAFVLNTDIEFDGQYYYSIAQGDPAVRRFNLDGDYQDELLLTKNGQRYDPQVGFALSADAIYTIGQDDPTVHQFTRSGVYVGDVTQLKDGNNIPLGTAYGTQPQDGLGFDGTYFYSIASGDARVRFYNMSGIYQGDYVYLHLPADNGGGPFGLNTGLAIGPPVTSANAPEPVSLFLLGGSLPFLFLLLKRRMEN